MLYLRHNIECFHIAEDESYIILHQTSFLSSLAGYGATFHSVHVSNWLISAPRFPLGRFVRWLVYS